jgi:hypothetical protein
MKKLVLGLLIGLIMVGGAFAQYKPMLITNGMTLEGDFVLSFDVVPHGDDKIVVYQKTSDFDIYAARFDKDGNVIWATTVDTATGTQRNPRACLTMLDKIVVVYESNEHGSSDLYAYELDPATGVKSQRHDVAVGAHFSSTVPQIVPDEAGGVFVGWIGTPVSNVSQMHMQHFTSSFTPWTEALTVEAATVEADHVDGFKIVSDSPNHRAAVLLSKYSLDLYLVTSEASDIVGNVVTSETITGNGVQPDIVKNSGDFIFTWLDDDLTIKAHRRNSDNSLSKVWVDPVTVTNAKIYLTGYFPRLVADNSGNAYIAWNDLRNLQITPPNPSTLNMQDVYMQKLNSSGIPKWQPNGIAVTSAEGVQGMYIFTNTTTAIDALHPLAYDSAADKIYITWHDFRRQPAIYAFTPLSLTMEADVFMQVISPDGSKLPYDLPLVSISSPEVLPSIFASSPMVFWRDYRSGYALNMQRADYLPTQITGIDTGSGTSNLKIQGVGFGTNPDYYNTDFAMNTSYNQVVVNGTPVVATAWSNDEVTVDLTYDSLLPGTYAFQVTAYGDPSNAFNLSKAADIIFQDVKFDGVDYSDGMAVKSSTTTVTGQVMSSHKIVSSSITVDGVKTNLARDANDKFSHNISSLSVGPHTIVLKATDANEFTAVYTCNVEVSSEISFDEIYFGERRYGGSKNNPEPALLSDTLKVKVTSDYAIKEFWIGSSGVEINVISYYSGGYLNVPLKSIGNFSGPSKITLRAKDANDNEVTQSVYFEISTKQSSEIKSVATQKVTEDSDGKIGFYYFPPESGSGASATAAATSRIRIILYSPAGRPLSLEQNVTIGYNEVTLPRNMFDSNGLYIVKIYDENNQHLTTTRVLVYLGK